MGSETTPVVPHSRYNDVAERDLDAAGYTILTRHPGIGVDAFVRQRDSLFVFLQGHPEYDADALGREYRRDVARFEAGQTDVAPPRPEYYFTGDCEAVCDHRPREFAGHSVSQLADASSRRRRRPCRLEQGPSRRARST